MSELKLNILKGKTELDQQETENGKHPSVDAFYFIQAADCQFGLIDRHFKKLADPGWREETELSEAFVSACNRLSPRPKFLIVCGDLVDAQPATRYRDAQVTEFKRIFSQLNAEIPLVCVCGNHDVGDIPTLESIEEYKREFGHDYFYFVVNNVLFIVINSQFYQNRDHVKEYAAEQDKWLESILDRCRLYRHSILFEHIPWFVEDLNEENQYFNIDLEIRLNWLRKFKEAGVGKIFCGHYHRNAGGWYGDMELVVTSAIGAQFGADKSGARLVKVTDNRIDHQYYASEDMPTTIEL